MRSRLVWKDKTVRTVLFSTVIGHFSMWAVRQSPYLVPEKLTEGIEEFSAALGSEDGFIATSCEGLDCIISDTIGLCETVCLWNNAKDDSNEPYVFVSRHDEPHPDHDIIDLSALARNIAHSVWLETLYNDGAFEFGAWKNETKPL